MSETASISPLVPREGWHVMHLFYQVDHAQWSILDKDEQRSAKTRLSTLIQEIRATPDTHLLTFSIATPKADIGFMLLTPDLQVANAFEKQLTLSLGPEVLSPVYSYLSQTESSEYTTTSEQYAEETLKGEKGLAEDSPEFAAAMKEFDDRMTHYLQHRLYPVLPDWPVVCFYPMSKKRDGDDNWFTLDKKTGGASPLWAGRANVTDYFVGSNEDAIALSGCYLKYTSTGLAYPYTMSNSQLTITKIL